jgi:hypothetical protein
MLPLSNTSGCAAKLAVIALGTLDLTRYYTKSLYNDIMCLMLVNTFTTK